MRVITADTPAVTFDGVVTICLIGSLGGTTGLKLENESGCFPAGSTQTFLLEDSQIGTVNSATLQAVGGAAWFCVLFLLRSQPISLHVWWNLFLPRLGPKEHQVHLHAQRSRCQALHE